MGKNIFIAITAVIGIILILVIASMLGFITIPGLQSLTNNGNDAPSPDDLGVNDTVDAEFDSFDIYSMLCILTDKNLDQDTTIEYIERLNMDVYGSDTSYVDIYGEYSLYYENHGWDIEIRTFPTDSAIIVYSKGSSGASVITSSRPVIQTMYGYNTMTLTSTGSIGTYTAFMLFIQNS